MVCWHVLGPLNNNMKILATSDTINCSATLTDVMADAYLLESIRVFFVRECFIVGDWLVTHKLIGPLEIGMAFYMSNFKLILVIDSWGTSRQIALIWTLVDLTDEKSTLVQLMVWCRQSSAITWTNADSDLCRHIALLCHNYINRWQWTTISWHGFL